MAERNFFHVVIWTGQNDKAVFLFGDLSERDLKSNFIRPYRRGHKLIVDGNLYDVASFSAVRIIETKRPKDEMLKELQIDSMRRIDEFNRDSPFVLISPGQGWNDEDIIDTGTNVTSKYINGPPGSVGVMAEALNHPWILTIVGGIIVAALAAFLGIA
ncbi:hypothetical protein GOC40_12195 [Sinorhizobium meliloti]|nr:hypothetical protein [Sinorhizobium meliloti]MDX0093430.1 hypothetical protein [Sinorhizobium meliloti]MDX0218754.1 hypothetical protein [Sinorhizobium meliloti]